MRNKKNIILKKIDLLLISLETLNFFFNKNIMYFNKIKIHHLDNTYKFINIISTIYSIRLTIKKYLIDEIAIEILINYTKSDNKNIFNYYNKKFYHIYSKEKEYYKNYKLLTSKQRVELSEISIINLYIISQLTKPNGIYLLIKYLSQ